LTNITIPVPSVKSLFSLNPAIQPPPPPKDVAQRKKKERKCRISLTIRHFKKNLLQDEQIHRTKVSPISTTVHSPRKLPQKSSLSRENFQRISLFFFSLFKRKKKKKKKKATENLVSTGAFSNEPRPQIFTMGGQA
jgi:hypothetical protein